MGDAGRKLVVRESVFARSIGRGETVEPGLDGTPMLLVMFVGILRDAFPERMTRLPERENITLKPVGIEQITFG
jgi:hypothetical protein